MSVARMLNQNGPSVSFSTTSNVARFAAGRVGGVGIRSFVSMHSVSTAITGKRLAKKDRGVNRGNYLVLLSSLPANRGGYVSTEF